VWERRREGRTRDREQKESVGGEEGGKEGGREIDREKRGAFFVLVVTVRCVKPVMGLERGYGEENHLRWLQGIEE
jgi:hypothetical protein